MGDRCQVDNPSTKPHGERMADANGFILFKLVFLAMMLLPCAALAGDEGACSAASAQAERRQQVPAGLLLAIAQVESGRADPVSGHVVPWPWTIHAAGAGRWFTDRSSAIAGTQALLAAGVRSIDVGCLQVNLAAHPAAFEGLDLAFSPVANADYAARLLASLRGRLGNWRDAIAAYHSATFGRGGPYRDLVLAAWQHPIGADPRSVASLLVPWSLLRSIAWSPAREIRVWKPSGGDAPNAISLPGTPFLPRVQTRDD